jgi:Lrp/AsnC family transcriptional regulator for asnA, asnC and gidA
LELHSNGQKSYKTIVKKLKVSGGTIRLRVRRPIRKNVLRISALSNPFSFEHSITTLIGMHLETRPIRETVDQLLKLNGVLNLSNTTGEFAIIAEVFLESKSALRRFLVEKLTRIPGIMNNETFVMLDGLNKWVEPTSLPT